MVFTSPIFLFAFLPLVLLVYYLVPSVLRNSLLLIASLFFYAWGENVYVLLMLVAIVWNYSIGLALDLVQDTTRKLVLSAGIVLNLLSLLLFKYTGFIGSTLGISWAVIQNIHLPLGISFFTFQSISYLVDVYRHKTSAQKNLLNLGLYIALFPQLIAGPIIRYGDVARQLLRRKHSIDLFAAGVERFGYGLAKKMLIANPLGLVADRVFALDQNYLSPELAWLGIISYALQIYFDFSGYSDMAIGLGRMFGFRFQENFNYPYIATSIRDFWRRWHISLSRWFRDYLYIPLGGSRQGAWRMYFNLVVVFFLCGLWHGASWSFVVWGLLHGALLVIERLGLGRLLVKVPVVIARFYTLLAVLLTWVFFRVDTLYGAIQYLGHLLAITPTRWQPYSMADFASHQFYLALGFGMILSTPVARVLTTRYGDEGRQFVPKIAILRLVLVSGLISLSIVAISASTYNPFIYFRF